MIDQIILDVEISRFMYESQGFRAIYLADSMFEVSNL